MINVYNSNFRPIGCNFSAESALFDGINDYAAGSGNTHWPLITTGSNANRVVVSMWIKSGFSTSSAGLKFMMGQNAGGLGSGDSSNQFFRIAYWMENSSGVDYNRLVVTYRGNTTTHMIEKQYALHGNTAITGSTSVTDKWLTGNTTQTTGNIITNSNDFVHLCVVMDLPPIGIPYGSAGEIYTYWNGQLLGNPVINTKQGVGTTSVNSVYGILGTNAANLQGYWNGNIDELQTLENIQTSSYSEFTSAFNLTTPQDIATFFWNDGCPVDTSHPSDFNWNYFQYRFENSSWNSEAGNNPFTPFNGATITSTAHA